MENENNNISNNNVYNNSNYDNNNNKINNSPSLGNSQNEGFNIICITCNTSLQSSPLKFDCNHFLCKTCFSRKLLLTRFSALLPFKNDFTFTCPCSSGSLSLSLEKCLAILSSPQQNKLKRCSHHSRPFKVYCQECKIWLCEECLTEFHNKYFIHHNCTGRPLTKRTNCIFHRNTPKDQFCVQCNKFICIECNKNTNEHGDHEMFTLEQYIHRKKRSLKYQTYSDIESYLDDKLKHIMDKHNNKINSIKTKIDYCIRQLENVKRECERSEEHKNYIKLLFEIVKKVYEAYYKEFKECKFSLSSFEFLKKVKHELHNVKYVSINLDAFYKAIRNIPEIKRNVFDIELNFNNTKQIKQKENETKSPITTLCVFKNKNYFVTGHEDGSILVFHSTKSNEVPCDPLCEGKGHERTVNVIKELTNAKDNDNVYFVSGSSDRSIKVWKYTINTNNNNDGKPLDCIFSFDKLSQIQTSPNESSDKKSNNNNKDEIDDDLLDTSVTDIIELSGERIASTVRYNLIKIWKVQYDGDGSINNFSSDKELKEGTSYEKCLCKIDDNLIASGSGDSKIKIWDVENQSVKKYLNGHNSYVNTLLLKDKTKLISGDGNGLIIVWDLQEHKNMNQNGHKKLKGHCDVIQGIVLLNENQIVSCSNDKSIRLWDLERLSCEAYLNNCHKSVIYGIGVINEKVIVT